jgi:hypothetical protein
MHVRIPAPLAKKLKASAETNLRSVAAEIIFILTKGLK